MKLLQVDKFCFQPFAHGIVPDALSLHFYYALVLWSRMQLLHEIEDHKEKEEEQLGLNFGLNSLSSLQLLVKRAQDYSGKVIQYHKIHSTCLYPILDSFKFKLFPSYLSEFRNLIEHKVITSKEAKALYNSGFTNQDQLRKARTYKVLRALNAPEEYKHKRDLEEEERKPRSLEVERSEYVKEIFKTHEQQSEDPQEEDELDDLYGQCAGKVKVEESRKKDRNIELKMKNEMKDSMKERKDIDYATTLISAAKANNKQKILASKRNQKMLIKLREAELN